MKNKWKIGSFLMIFSGVIWFFQGIDIIKGSFMTGEIIWSVIGSLFVAGGLWIYQEKVK